MKIYIAGANGGMGRRYKAILRHLGHEVWGFDLPDFSEHHELAEQVRFEAESSDAAIIATPTETHLDMIDFFRLRDRPMLCEKPISKDLALLEKKLAMFSRKGAKLQMVSQYDYLLEDIDEGPTYYNYFKTGNDGLFWDCINVVKHAKGKITLKNDSPIWQCWINGQKLNLGHMDQAYIEMVKDWLANLNRTDFDGIWAAHKKVHDLEAKCRAS